MRKLLDQIPTQVIGIVTAKLWFFLVISWPCKLGVFSYKNAISIRKFITQTGKWNVKGKKLLKVGKRESWMAENYNERLFKKNKQKKMTECYNNYNFSDSNVIC